MASSPNLRDICGLTLLALVLNFVHSGTKSLVLDESVSANWAHLPLVSLFPVLAGVDRNMSLYHLLLHFWVRIFGESEIALRGMSALFGALAVSASYQLGTRLFGRRVGFAAGFLLALNSFMVEAAQTARSYTLLVWLVTLSSWFLVVELERPSQRSRIGYVLMSTAAIYAHYVAAYVLLVHAGTVVAMSRRDAFTRRWLAVATAILLLCSPEIVIAYRAGGKELSWITAPSLNDIQLVLVDLAGGSLLALILLLVSGFYATVFAIRRRGGWPVGFIAAWLFVPIALCFAVSYLVPMFLPSHLVICIPALMLFGTAAIAGPRGTLPAVVLVAPVAALFAVQLATYYRGDSEHQSDAVGAVEADALRVVVPGVLLLGDRPVVGRLHARRACPRSSRRGRCAGPSRRGRSGGCSDPRSR